MTELRRLPVSVQLRRSFAFVTLGVPFQRQQLTILTQPDGRWLNIVHHKPYMSLPPIHPYVLISVGLLYDRVARSIWKS